MKNRARPGKHTQVSQNVHKWRGIGQVEVNASECPHSQLMKTRDCCWDKGQELSKEKKSKKPRETKQSLRAGLYHLAAE